MSDRWRPRWRSRCRGLAAPLLLAALVALIYARVAGLGFVFDDSVFFAHDSHVRTGITPAGLRWLPTAVVAGMWHPLSVLSLMLDVQLFGVNAAAHHVVNALLHLANTLVLFFLLLRASGRVWRSAAVAALFAAHPMHVESVAWISERKDVLATFLGLCALHAWVSYARRPGVPRYLLAALCFALSLAAKPMLVTLPFVLLLLDFWPLGRPLGLRTLGEKIPLLVASAGVSVVAFLAQSAHGAMSMAGTLPLVVRAANAAAAYLAYLGRTLWPADLAVMYPHPGAALPAWRWLSGVGCILVLGLLALRARRRQPWLTTGVLWFLGTLVPVIGLVQVGEQAFADRYTYVPLIGLFLAAAWALPALLPAPAARRLIAGVAVAVTIVCAAIAGRQIDFWKDNRSLYGHAVAAAPGSWLMHANLGAELLNAGEIAAAAVQMRESARLQPGLAQVHVNLATVLARLDRPHEAVEEYRLALRLEPQLVGVSGRLGAALLRLGRPQEAVPHLERAAQQSPGEASAWSMLGLALANSGRWAEALAAHRRALDIAPRRADFHSYLGADLEALGRYPEAAAALREAARLEPVNVFYRHRLETLLARAAGGRRTP